MEKPEFYIPNPEERPRTPQEIACQEQGEARRRFLENAPEFVVPSAEALAEQASDNVLLNQPSTKPRRKKAYLPAILSTDELRKYGYQQITPERAKHKRYNSFRNLCVFCGLWTKQAYGLACKKHLF